MITLAFFIDIDYVIFYNLEYYLSNPSQILNFRGGGMAIHGGLIAGIVVGIIYTKRKNINFFKMADIVMIGMPLSQSIGRWGNYINQEAYGSPTDLPWAITINGIGVHPTFLYESIWNFVLFIFLWNIRKKKKFEGQILTIYIMMYSLGRLFIEALRTDSLMIGSIRVAQLISLLGIIGGGILYKYLENKNKNGSKDKE